MTHNVKDRRHLKNCTNPEKIFFDNGVRKVTLELKGAVCHAGFSALSGHYIAYIRDPLPNENRFYKCDNLGATRPQPMSTGQDIAEHAYVLEYEVIRVEIDQEAYQREQQRLVNNKIQYLDAKSNTDKMKTDNRAIYDDMKTARESELEERENVARVRRAEEEAQRSAYMYTQPFASYGLNALRSRRPVTSSGSNASNLAKNAIGRKIKFKNDRRHYKVVYGADNRWYVTGGHRESARMNREGKDWEWVVPEPKSDLDRILEETGQADAIRQVQAYLDEAAKAKPKPLNAVSAGEAKAPQAQVHRPNKPSKQIEIENERNIALNQAEEEARTLSLGIAASEREAEARQAQVLRPNERSTNKKNDATADINRVIAERRQRHRNKNTHGNRVGPRPAISRPKAVHPNLKSQLDIFLKEKCTTEVQVKDHDLKSIMNLLSKNKKSEALDYIYNRLYRAGISSGHVENAAHKVRLIQEIKEKLPSIFSTEKPQQDERARYNRDIRQARERREKIRKATETRNQLEKARRAKQESERKRKEALAQKNRETLARKNRADLEARRKKTRETLETEARRRAEDDQKELHKARKEVRKKEIGSKYKELRKLHTRVLKNGTTMLDRKALGNAMMNIRQNKEHDQEKALQSMQEHTVSLEAVEDAAKDLQDLRQMLTTLEEKITRDGTNIRQSKTAEEFYGELDRNSGAFSQKHESVLEKYLSKATENTFSNILVAKNKFNNLKQIEKRLQEDADRKLSEALQRMEYGDYDSHPPARRNDAIQAGVRLPAPLPQRNMNGNDNMEAAWRNAGRAARPIAAN